MGRRLAALAASLLLMSLLPAAPSRAATQHGIAVGNFVFDPKVVRATAGDNVKWSVNDWGSCWQEYDYASGTYRDECSGHDISTYGGASSFYSGNVTRGVNYMQPFNGGTVLYRCTIHSSLSNGECTGMCGALTDRSGPPATPTLRTPSDGAELDVESLVSQGGVYYNTALRVEFRGAAEPWTVVSVYEGSTVLAKGLAGGSGEWTLTATLPVGSHSLFIRSREVEGSTADSQLVNVEVRGAPEADFTIDYSAATRSFSPQVLSASAGRAIKWTGLGGGTTPAEIIAHGGSSDMSSGPNAQRFPVYVKTFGGGTALYRTLPSSISDDGTCVGACAAITDRTGPPLAPQVTYPAAGASIASTSVAISIQGEPWTTVSLHEGTAFFGRKVLDASGTFTFPPRSFVRGFHTLSLSARDVAGGVTDATSTFKVHLPPESPQHANASPGPGAGMISLRWSPPADHGGATSYRIYGRDPGAGASLLAEVPFHVNEFQDSGLGEGAQRIYRIAAVNEAGEGTPTADITSQAPSRPTSPRDLEAFPAPEFGSILLNWAHPQSSGGVPITSYRVYRATHSSGYSLIATAGTVPSYTDRGCRLGMCYYKVVAVNAVGPGPYSNESSFPGIKNALF